MSVEIPPSEIAVKRTVGKSNGKDVIYVKTIGGLHLMFLKKDKPDLLAAAPHIGVAKFLALENDPSIEWTELSKSNHLEYSQFEHILPEYRSLTEELKKAI